MMAVLRQNIAIYVLISIILVENFSFYSAFAWKTNFLSDSLKEREQQLREKLDLHRQALLNQPKYARLHKHFVNVLSRKLDDLKAERTGQSNHSTVGNIGGKRDNLLSLIKTQLLKRWSEKSSNQTKGPENIDPRIQEAAARERRTLFVLNLLANRYQDQLDQFRKKYGTLTPQQIDRLRGYIDNVGKRREKHLKRLQEAEKKLSLKKNQTSNDVRSREIISNKTQQTSFGKIIADNQSNITQNAKKPIESVSEWNARNEKDILVSLNRSINYNKVLLTDHKKATENKFKYGLLKPTLVEKVKWNMNSLIQAQKNLTEMYNLNKVNSSKEHDKSLNVKPDAGTKHTTVVNNTETHKTPVSHPVSAKSRAKKVEQVFNEVSIPETHDEHIIVEATKHPTTPKTHDEHYYIVEATNHPTILETHDEHDIVEATNHPTILETHDEHDIVEATNHPTILEPHGGHDIVEASNQPTKDHGSAFDEKLNPKMKSTEIFDMYHILLDELKNLTAATNQFQKSKKVVGRKNHKIVLVKFPTANVNDEIKNQLENKTHNIVLTKNEEINFVGNNDYNKE